MQHFVVVAESFEAHAAESVDFFNVQVKITHQKIGEVETCHLEEQLVFVDRVGLVSDEQDEVGVTFGFKDAGSYRVAVGEHIATSFPHVTHVKLTAMETSSFLHTVDNHTCHGTHRTFWIFLHHGFHIAEASLTVTIVEFAKTTDKDEFVTVGSQLETLC